MVLEVAGTETARSQSWVLRRGELASRECCHGNLADLPDGVTGDGEQVAAEDRWIGWV